MNITVGRKAIADATAKLRNWGRWGKDDQIGTLNHILPEDIVRAAGLIRTGKVFALGIPLDRRGPQSGLFGGRWNPIHTMLATGTDAVAGRYDKVPGIRYSDDAINLPVQAATHWDSLGHIFYEEQMYNGFDAREVDCNGLGKLGIEHTKNKMVGRGVLLDVARFRGVPWLDDGEAISNDELDKCAKEANVEIRRGDFVILRTGQMERCLHQEDWGAYAGGPAPGVRFENCYWCYEKEIAAICSDTWGIEVRPNESSEVNQPWHWVVIPAMGLTMGEMFYLKELAEDCDADGTTSSSSVARRSSSPAPRARRSIRRRSNNASGACNARAICHGRTSPGHPEKAAVAQRSDGDCGSTSRTTKEWSERARAVTP